MSRTISSPALAFLLFLASAATALAQREAHTVWQITDSGPDDTRCRGLLRMPGGDLVFAGNVPGNGSDLLVARLDEDGQFLWTRRVANPNGSNYFLPQAIARSPLDDEIVVMAQLTGGATAYDIFFVALDPDDGHVLASRTLDHLDWDLPVDMEIGPSGNIVMCEYGIDPGQYLVTKLDHSFQTLWKVDLGNPGQDDQEPTDLVIAANGDVLVTGQVSDGVQRDVRVDRLTQNGTLLYSKDFGDPAFDDYDGVLYASPNSGTYFAFRKAAFEPTAEARIYRLDQSGNVTWGIVDPALAWVKIEEIDNDQFIIAGVGPFAGGLTAQTFRKFDKLGNKLGIVTLPTVGYEHNWIVDMTVGPDDIIYTTAYATPNGGDGTDWFVNALTVDGGLVFQWSLNSGSGTYDFPNGLAALGHGRIVVCGEQGDVNDDDAHIRELQAQLTQAPDTATVLSGQLVHGDVDSLAGFDADDYIMSRAGGGGLNTSSSPVAVEIEAALPPLYPRGSLALAFTARATTLGLTQNLELWNWRLGVWDRSTESALTTAYATTVILGSVADHVDAATGRVKMRCEVSGPATISSPWLVAIARAVWLVQP